jgi:hypothetical protein
MRLLGEHEGNDAEFRIAICGEGAESRSFCFASDLVQDAADEQARAKPPSRAQLSQVKSAGSAGSRLLQRLQGQLVVSFSPPHVLKQVSLLLPKIPPSLWTHTQPV